ncbi:MAG: nucleotidyltransferase family protein [Spirochaetota bacterium]
MLSGLILAAGESKRMEGKPKALLLIDGESFLERIINNMSKADIGELVVVLGADHEKIEAKVNMMCARIVINRNWKQGQLSSLQAGINSLSPLSEGVLFTLVDHPLVRTSTYVELAERWKENRDRVIVASYQGRKGHPTIFPRRLYRNILEEEHPFGARSIIKNEGSSVLFVQVDDPGVVQDIDTIEDYRRLIG